MRKSYPILLFDEDVKEAFCHCKCHPDVSNNFAYTISNILYFLFGGTVESTTSLANFEPPDHARTHLAQHLSHTK